jgi:cytochrome oxidase Cu insertion factor (SCO1/SenC/PrrC family)
MSSHSSAPSSRFAASLRITVGLIFALLWWGLSPAVAQGQSLTPGATQAIAATHPALGTSPTLQGKRLDGHPFSLRSLQGKVVLVFFWSTSCPVCRDKMPELRENYAGWRKQAFELVTVSVDPHRKDIEDYEQIMTVMVPTPQRFIQLWAGEPGYRDSFFDGAGMATGKTTGRSAQLPSAYLIDKAGKVVETYTGRIPAEAWDRIAELL